MKQPRYLEVQGFLRFQILHSLRRQKLCGDELAELIGRKKGSKLTPGTIYPALKYLRKKKLVKHRKYGRKKIYTITDEGKKEYLLFKRNFLRIYREIFNK